jgi:tetratricopeptide (TPR) repeat protein
MDKSFGACLLSAFILAAALSVRTAHSDYKQAVAYYNQRQYDKAIQELKKDLDSNPDWEFGHRLLGLCYLGLRNNALAVSSLSRAAQLKSPAFATYYALGQAYFNMQKYDNCIAALNQAEPLAAKEKDPEKEALRLLRLRGAAHFELQRYGDAVEDLTRVLRQNPSDWTDHYRLGISYFKLNRTEEAVQTLEKALSMKPEQSDIRDVLAKAYLKKGGAALSGKQYAAAVQSLLKAKEYDPQNGYVDFNLGEAYLFEKKYPEAEKALNQAAQSMPGNAEVYGRLGLVYEKQKKWDLALKAYKKAGELSSAKWITDAIARVKENSKR